MQRWTLAATLVCCAIPVAAHVTPTTSLVRRADFLRESLAGATRFYEKTIDRPALETVRQATGWRPSPEETRVYVGRDAAGNLVGTVVFLWMASQHGPMGIGAAFDAGGVLREAAVTEIGTEPLAWVRPLLAHGRVDQLSGLPLDRAPEAQQIAPSATGAMSRYYARVIAEGVRRAQAVAASLGTGAR